MKTWEIVVYFIVLILAMYGNDCVKEWEKLSKEEQKNTSVWEFVKQFIKSKIGKK